MIWSWEVPLWRASKTSGATAARGSALIIGARAAKRCTPRSSSFELWGAPTNFAACLRMRQPGKLLYLGRSLGAEKAVVPRPALAYSIPCQTP
jgi:hypothetical protein